VVTFVANNSFTAGLTPTISLPFISYLNGQSLTILAAGLSSTQFSANFTHADVTSTAQTGFATTTGIHDSQFCGDGTCTVMSVTGGNYARGTCSGKFGGAIVWTVGTSTTQWCIGGNGQTGNGGQHCGGHNSVGTSKMLDTWPPTDLVSTIRPLSNVLLATTWQTATTVNDNQHGFWPQPDHADDYPWIATTYDMLPAVGTVYNPVNLGNAIFAQYPLALNQPYTIFGHTYNVGSTDASIAMGLVQTGPNWTAGKTYTLNPTVTIITPTSGNAGHYSYEATVAGTGGGSAPTWTQTPGASVTDGGATLVNIGVAGASVVESYFACQDSIMSVSQDGNWGMLASSMLQSLGLDSAGKPACHGFIVHIGNPLVAPVAPSPISFAKNVTESGKFTAAGH
jgi:hypothetical protein